MPESVDDAATRRAVEVLFEPGQVVEVRALNASTPGYRRPHTVSGYFDDFSKLVSEAARVASYASGVYITLNPVNLPLLARSANRLKAVGERDTLTGDRDVLYRRWLPLDFDPVRPSGVSSSQAEHEAAFTRAAEVRQFLDAQGFPAPVQADSGNGAHLLYRVELPVDDNGLSKRTLESISLLHSDEQVNVDTAMFNPARICKLYGTVARKGDHTPDRPHRLSKLLSVPAQLVPIPIALLEKVAELAPKPAVEVSSGYRSAESFDLRGLLDKSGIGYRGPLPWNGGQKYVLETCPFNPEHKDRSAYVVQFGSGAIAAGCHHASCQGKGWSELHSLLQPGWRERKKLSTKSVSENFPAPSDVDNLAQTSKAASVATQLVKLADENSALFHSPEGIPYAWIKLSDHQEVVAIRSMAFREYISRKYYQQQGSVPGSQALQDSISLLAARAVYDGLERNVFTRLGYRDGKLYFDLTDPTWRVVEISSDGWRVLKNSPVAFQRTRNARALPLPSAGGNLSALLNFANLSDPSNQRLLQAFLLGMLAPDGPYPILALYGEHGSAKTTLSRLIKELTDPVHPILRGLPRNEHDLMIATLGNRVLAFDNTSRLQPWLSDALCRLSTGGGFGTRKLYSDEEEIVLDAKRPVVLNGISEMVTRGDLLDRAIILELSPIPDSQRKNEKSFWDAFSQQQPFILGALLDIVCSILRNLPHLQTPELPRMADFAAWIIAAEPALGWKPGTFLRDYSENHAGANAVVIESSPLGNTLVAYLTALRQTTGEVLWRGTASALWQALEQTDPNLALDSPMTPQHLSGELRRLAPNLRSQGVDIQFDERVGHKRERLIRIDFVNLDSADADLQAGSGEGISPEEDQSNSSSASVRSDDGDAEACQEFEL